MSRVFITFATGENYLKLAEVLEESINRFSEYKLIVYKPEDFNIEYNSELWDGPGSVNFSYKIISCLTSLETYDEVVWLDNDIIVTRNIDNIWDNQVDNYPLLPNERFNNFSIPPSERMNCQDINFLSGAKQKIGVMSDDFNNYYLQACCMLFNKNCKDFFNEVLNYYQDFDSNLYPYSDESIINCMIWRDKLSRNLGDVFLCTHYFSPYIIEAVLSSENAEEYNNLFDINYRIMENEDTFILSHGWTLARHNRIGMINNNYDNLLFLHGSKSADLHRGYLNCIK